MLDIPIVTIRWLDETTVEVLDQRLLPHEERLVPLRSAADAWRAIRDLAVRGAPLVGLTAAAGFALGALDIAAGDPAEAVRRAGELAAYLESSRPTAVNLAWAVERTKRAFIAALAGGPRAAVTAARAEAARLIAEDAAANRALGEHMLPLLTGARRVLTHCNAGWLATGGYGTALAALYLLRERGLPVPHVWIDETRPVLQGARLTAWELARASIPCTLISDSAAATVIAQGRVDVIVVGCDRMAANGDFANKIGTYPLAIVAREHGVPLYAAVPTSSIDLSLPGGGAIPIEERPPDEVRAWGGRAVAPAEVPVFNPAFDVTPHRYLTAAVTEAGVVRSPFSPGLAEAVRRAEAAAATIPACAADAAGRDARG